MMPALVGVLDSLGDTAISSRRTRGPRSGPWARRSGEALALDEAHGEVVLA